MNPRRSAFSSFSIALLLGLAGCGQPAPEPEPEPELEPEPHEPIVVDQLEALHAMWDWIEAAMESTEVLDERLKVQHVQLSFGGTPTVATRYMEEAEILAAEVFARARAGEDFEVLMELYSDDQGPGTYEITSETRGEFAAFFGHCAWRLAVGEIGVAPFDTAHSPYGWHVIKRLE